MYGERVGCTVYVMRVMCTGMRVRCTGMRVRWTGSRVMYAGMCKVRA